MAPARRLISEDHPIVVHFEPKGFWPTIAGHLEPTPNALSLEAFMGFERLVQLKWQILFA
jgi:hypothetical protein